MKVVHLDCTLRDGGYYNNWDFELSAVEQYLNVMDQIGVDYVEIGFRSSINSIYRGPFAYTTDQFLSAISIPIGIADRLGVMVNGAELLDNHSVLRRDVLESLFQPACDSPVSLVRIAVHAHEFQACLPAASWLSDLGYSVGFNLMQIDSVSDSDILQLASLANAEPIAALYFADSLGCLRPNDIRQLVERIRLGWTGDIGVHTHDNLGSALSNTLEAVECGVSWIDSTVTGMGRGPGNAKTEFLIQELPDREVPMKAYAALMDLIKDVFAPLQFEYGWGTNPFYYMAGLLGIHPSYIQTMLSDTRFSTEDVVTAIANLESQGDTRSFRKDRLARAKFQNNEISDGDWCPANEFYGKDVLALANGASLATHSAAILQFIEKKKPVVISLNRVGGFKSELIDYHVSIHPMRLASDISYYKCTNTSLITSKSAAFAAGINLDGLNVLNYELALDAGKFSVAPTHCKLPSALVAAYMLAICCQASCPNIYLAGFDGYAADDPRTAEMNELLSIFYGSSLDHRPNLLCLTPTSFNIATRSIYGPI